MRSLRILPSASRYQAHGRIASFSLARFAKPQQLGGLLSFVILTGCAPSPTSQPPPLSDAPAIIIRQYSDYPALGRASEFPDGLVAALWRDGRIIRSTSLAAVGQTYVEGVVSTAQRDAFITFLNNNPVTRSSVEGSVPLHVATQSITVLRDDKEVRWTRVLPDRQSAWGVIESRLLALPIQRSRAIPWTAVQAAGWND